MPGTRLNILSRLRNLAARGSGKTRAAFTEWQRLFQSNQGAVQPQAGVFPAVSGPKLDSLAAPVPALVRAARGRGHSLYWGDFGGSRVFPAAGAFGAVLAMALCPAGVSPAGAQQAASAGPPSVNLSAIVASLWACTAAAGGRECGRVVWGDGTVSDVLAIGGADRVAWPWAVAMAATAQRVDRAMQAFFRRAKAGALAEIECRLYDNQIEKRWAEVKLGKHPFLRLAHG